MIGTRQVLNKAADLIEEVGLVKGAFKRSDGVCALGAISEVCNRHGGNFFSADTALRRQIYGEEHGSIIRWNDAPERTQEEVVATMRKAAA